MAKPPPKKRGDSKRKLTTPRREGVNRPSRTLLGAVVPPRPLHHPANNTLVPSAPGTAAPARQLAPGTTEDPAAVLADSGLRAVSGSNAGADRSIYAEDEEPTQVYDVSEAPPRSEDFPDEPTRVIDSPLATPTAPETVVVSSELEPVFYRKEQISGERTAPGGIAAPAHVQAYATPGLPPTAQVLAQPSAPLSQRATVRGTRSPYATRTPYATKANASASRTRWALIGVGAFVGLVGLGVVFRRNTSQSPAPVRVATATSPTAQLPASPIKNKPEPEQNILSLSAKPTNLEPLLTGISTDKRPTHCARWVEGLDTDRVQTSQAKSAWHLARKALQSGHIDVAEQRLCQSMHFNSAGPGTADLVRFYFSQGDLSAATQWAKWSTLESPKDTTAKLLLADALHQQGHLAEAQELLFSALGITAADQGVRQGVARRNALNGFRALDGQDPSRAKRLFRRAVTLDAKSALAAAGMATMALSEKHQPEALLWARKSVSLDANSYHAHLALGDALLAGGQKAAAKASWQRATSLNPSSKLAQRRLSK